MTKELSEKEKLGKEWEKKISNCGGCEAEFNLKEPIKNATTKLDGYKQYYNK